MSREDKIKLFGMSHFMVERSLDKVEQKLDIDLGRDRKEYSDKEDVYYPQFAEEIRNQASEMGAHYELFYCLEISIRSLIKEKMKSEFGSNWWEEKVAPDIRENAIRNYQREIDSAVTPRSTDDIDYTTFGELGEIVRQNWEAFGDIFNSRKGFTKVMTSLNVLRGPIAHCSPLAEDEVVRLRLTVGDWFRLME